MTAAALARDAGIPLNYHFLWELEEEIGAPTLPPSSGRGGGRSRRTPSWSPIPSGWRGTPSIPYGLRGLLPLSSPSRPPGPTSTPAWREGSPGTPSSGYRIRRMLRCGDREGEDSGFYDGVKKPREGELEQSFRPVSPQKGSPATWGSLLSADLTTDLDVVKAFSLMPTFEVHGITGGYTGPGAKAIVPHRAEARVSMRLVPGQDPARIARLFREFVKRQNPDIRVTTFPALQPYLGDYRGPYADAACSAMKAAFGKEPAFTREGGPSVPWWRWTGSSGSPSASSASPSPRTGTTPGTSTSTGGRPREGSGCFTAICGNRPDPTFPPTANRKRLMSPERIFMGYCIDDLAA